MNNKKIKELCEIAIKYPLIWVYFCPVFIGTAMTIADGVFNLVWAIESFLFSAFLYFIIKFIDEKFKSPLKLPEFLAIFLLGPGLCAGTYYLQSGEMNLAVLLAGFAPGLLAASLIVLNKIPDLDNYTKINFAILEYFTFTFCAALMPIFIYFITEDHVLTLLSPAICFLSIPLITVIFKNPQNLYSYYTTSYSVIIILTYTIIFSVGWFF